MSINEEKLELCNKFIKAYCLPEKNTRYDTREPNDIDTDWSLLQLALLNEYLDLDVIANYLKALPYKQKFIYTPYWLICRNKKLLDDNFLCQLDFRHNNRRLQVHHKTYKYHGYEAQHMDCLTTLCADCHDLVSNGYTERKEPEINWSFRLEEFNDRIEKLHKQKELTDDLEVLMPVLTPSDEVILNAYGVHPYDKATIYLERISAQCVRIHTFLIEFM